MPRILRSSLVLITLLSLVIVVAPSPLQAQTTIPGRISGTLTDPSGAVVPGATVVVTNEATGLSRTVTSNNTGFYVATNLAVGTYSVAAEEKGFSRTSKTGVRVDADARVTVDMALQTGQVSQTVEVTAAPTEAVNTVSGEISRTVDEKTVQDTALNARNFMELVGLIPGVVRTTDDAISDTYGINISNQSVNGSRTDQNMVTVDGGFNMDSGSNGSPINNVGIDFIQEVTVKTSNFSAEYGRISGSNINIVTRSGGNRFHGSVFEFLRNDWFDAINYFSPICTAANPCLTPKGFLSDGSKYKPTLRFNDYGWSLGGPLKKNKIFFFAGNEWKKIRQNNPPRRLSMPPTAYLNGNFTGLSTTLKKPANAPAGCTIVNNILSPQCITVDGAAIGKLYGALDAAAASFTDAAKTNNATYQPFQPYDWRQDIVRLDYHINDAHSMYFRYLHDTTNVGLAYGFSCSGSTEPPACPQDRKRPGYSYQLSETWLISPSVVNQASITAAWNGQRLTPEGDIWQRAKYGFVFPQIFGASGGGRFRNSIPDISVTNWPSLKGQSHALLSPTTDITPSDTITWTRGNHTVKTGFQLTRNRKDQNSRSLYAGSVSFSTTGNTNSTGYALADALMGNFNSYQEAADDPVGLFRFTQYQAFATDNWKLRRDLSVEYGVRYEHRVPTYTLGNDIANFDPAAYNAANAVTVTSSGSIDTTKGGNPLNGIVRVGSGVPQDQLQRYPIGTSPQVLAVPAGAPRGVYDSKNLIAPRLGFAWAPFGNDATAVRGGFGIFYDTPEGNIIFPLLSNPPFTQSTSVTNGNLSNPLAGKAAGAGLQGNISAIDPHFVNPYTMSYSLSVQRQMPKGVFLEVAYVGNQSRHQIRKPDINQPSLASLVANVPATGNISSGLKNSLRPYKGYQAINMFLSDAIGSYNGLQTFVTKRRGNLTVQAGYTWSRALADVGNSITDTESDNIVAITNRHYSYGPSDNNRTHVFTSNYSYNFPWFRKQQGFVGYLIGGWEASGVTRFQTGAPQTVTATNALGSSLRADYLGGGISASDPTPDHWFNTAAFAVAPPTRLGTAGSNTIVGPGLFTWDMSLRKDFHLWNEGTRLQFRADMFNILNHTNFHQPEVSVTNNSFGTISAAGPPRQIQLALKLNF
jgi:hypothetical protein